MSEACYKDYAIHIDPLVPPSGCPDWGTMAWGVPFFSMIGNANATFTPDSAASGTFTGMIYALDPDAFDYAESENTASIAWAGTPCDGNLHLVLTTTGVAPNTHIVVIVNVPSIGDVINVGYDPGPGVSVYDLPFSLPVDAPQNIGVFVEAQMGIAVGETQLDFTGTFTTV